MPLNNQLSILVNGYIKIMLTGLGYPLGTGTDKSTKVAISSGLKAFLDRENLP
jgi:hypothetical protein